MTDALNDFRNAMSDAGLRFSGEIVADGKLHRFYVDGDTKGKENGWYVLHLDGLPAGSFGSWKTGQKELWRAKSTRSLSPSERKELDKKIAAQKAQRDDEEKRVQAEAARRAKDIWDASTSVGEHDYLRRKGIQPLGVRLSRDNLVVPVRSSDGAIHSLQFISPDGTKRFLSGGRIDGGYCALTKPGASREVILICEGYATGASLSEATELPVVVAFQANNLKPVALAIRAKYPNAKIVVCADNDSYTSGNPGIAKGTEAALEVKGVVTFPVFENPLEGSFLTDFNDLAQNERDGKARVLCFVLEALDKLEPKPEKAKEVAKIKDPPDLSLVKAEMPFTNDKGKPLGVIENVKHLLSELEINVRYNVVTKEEEILIPGQSFSIDNKANASLAWLTSLCNKVSMPTSHLGDYVTYLADQNLHNPVVSWVTSKKWDGVSRLEDLYRTVTAKNEVEDPSTRLLKNILIKRWLVSAVAAAFRPQGVSAHGVLVFQGEQYLGKTSWFKRLVPSELSVIADGMMLDPKDRDSVKQAVSFWLVELGELDATFRRSDIAQLKSFLTRDKDVLRRAFAKKDSEYARRTVFFGSVNPKQFLHDDTGNRRYWTIECEAIDHSHSIDMQQLWAEVYEALYLKGEKWYLSHEEMIELNRHNEGFTTRDAFEERIGTELNWSASENMWEWKTVTQVLIDLGVGNPRQADIKKASQEIAKRNGGRRRKSNGNMVLLAPPRYSQIAFVPNLPNHP